MPSDLPIEPEGARDAVRAHVDKLTAETGSPLSPEARRGLEGSSEAMLRSLDPDDARIRGVKYVDENGKRIDPSRVRPAD